MWIQIWTARNEKLYRPCVTQDTPDLDWWTTSDAAEYCGMSDQTWRTYISRGQAPAPDVRIGGKPLWRPATVREWQAARPGRGWRLGKRGDGA
jgi:predicted DNA-binding transcriptional regulator AlpA